MRRAIAALTLATFTACAGGSEVSGDRRAVGGVAMTFTVRPARVEVGSPVRFTIRLNNVSGQETELDFATGQMYDFTVTRGKTTVWRWSDGRFFTQSLSTRTIEPLGFLTFAEIWRPTRAGSFTVHGELKAQGYGRELDGHLDVGG
jgi:hypothetical protein